jgi:hypothetical protein
MINAAMPFKPHRLRERRTSSQLTACRVFIDIDKDFYQHWGIGGTEVRNICFAIRTYKLVVIIYILVISSFYALFYYVIHINGTLLMNMMQV